MFNKFFKPFSVIFLLAMFAFSQNSFAQTMFSENFDGAWTIPSTLSPAWSGVGTGNLEWHRNDYTTGWTSTSGSYSPTGALSTTNSARFHTYDATSGTSGSIVTPVYDFSGYANSKLLYFYHINTTGTDVVKVYLSVDGGATYGSALATIGVSAAWTQYMVNLGTTTSSTVTIKFEATSDFGTTDIGIDQMSIVNIPIVPLVGGTSYPINGTEAPPTSFATITSSLTYMALHGVTGSGQVFLELSPGYVSAGEPGPVSINAIPGVSSTLGVTFRPALGYTALTTIAGGASPNQHAIKLNACSYVTLDGRAGGVGTSRDWNIKCTGANGQMAVRLDNTSGSMTGDIIRNLIMEAEVSGSTGAIFQITGSTTNTISNIDINGNLIRSNPLAATFRGYGITLAVASNVGNTGILCRNNDITQFSMRGINHTGGFPGIEIYGNEIHHTASFTQSTATEFFGIYNSTTTSPGAKIYNNYLHDFQLTNGSTSYTGIYFFNGNTTGARMQVYNNRVVMGIGLATGFPIYGIRDNSVAGALIDVYFNSVLINGTATSGAINSAAFIKGVSNFLNVKNNVFYNTRTNSGGTGVHWAISTNNTTFTSIGNNDYFADGTGGVLGTTTGLPAGNQTTILGWQSVVTTDLGSVSQNPNYLADLKINTAIPTQLESGGATGTGITLDFEGDTRLSPPDIGADEFTGTALDLTPPAIVYTLLLNTNSISNRSLSPVVITDANGVNGTTGTSPRIYFKKSTDANAFVGNTSTDNGWKWTEATGSSPFSFTIDNSIIFGGSVTTGDVVQYFVVAQDLASPNPPNVGANPSAGFVGTSVSAITSAPTTPNSYIISQAPLSGPYTVGLLPFNQVTGKNIYFEKVVTKVMKEVEVPVIEPKEEKGRELRNVETTSSDKPQTIKKLMEVEEISWIPMENGQQYYGDLYIKKAENPQFNYPDNTNGIYATITAALADLNLRGVNGATTFLLNDASYPTETYPLTVNVANEGNFPTATNTVTIKPNSGVTSAISGTAASTQIFKVLNSYVTIDGSNSGGTDRSLSIQNLSTTAPQVVVIGSVGTTPNVGSGLKNCIIINGVNTSSAVLVTSGTAPGSAGYFNNITIQNNSLQLAYIALYCNAVVLAGNGTGLNITGNDINTSGTNSVSSVGIYVQGVDGATVMNNNVANFNTTTSNYRYGIWFATGTTNSTISNNNVGNLNTSTSYYPFGITLTPAVANSNNTVTGNTVHDFTSTSSGDAVTGIYVGGASGGIKIQKNLVYHMYNTYSGGYGAWGIALSSSLTASNIEVSNNMIYDVMSYGYASILYENGIGLFLNSGGGYNIYYNSVYLYTNPTSGSSMCLYLTSAVSTASSLDIRNNIFQNNNTVNSNYCIYSGAANTIYADINYNDYYAASSTNGYVGYLGGNQQTLSAWQTATGKDLNSISADPKFVSNTDLHINTLYNVVDAKAQYLAAVLNDFDGNVRNVSTPDIGADEYVYVPPTVNDPTGVSASAISNTQIDVAFTPNGSSNNVVIVYNLTGTFTTPSGTPTVGGSLAGGEVLYINTLSPYNHTGLTGSTHYYYKLFSYDGSIYSGGVTTDATTNASPISPPYVQAFEGTFPPTGWTTYGTKTWNQSLTGGVGGTKCARVLYSPAGTANLQMPPLVIPASPNYRIKFWWKDNDISAMMNGDKGEKSKQNVKGKLNKGIKNSGDGIQVAGYDTTFFEISTNGGTTWTVKAFLSAASTQSSYSEVIQNLDSYAGQTISVRWRDWSDGSGSAWGVGLDDITVEEIPSCPAPTGLTVAGITNNSANIGWSGATTVDIDYGAPGHPAGTGTVLNSITANPYTLGSLTSSTPYDVFVRQSCGSGSFSSWAGPLSFTTACDIVLAPWSESFEGGFVPPSCWSVTGTSGLWITGLASGYGTGSFSAKADFYNVIGTSDLISLGYSTSSLTNPILKFDWAYATYTDGAVDEMDIYYSTNSGTTWTLLLAMPGGLNGILNPLHIQQSGSFTPTASQWSSMSLSLPAGSNLVKFTAISAYGNNLYVDNIKVEEAPAVPVFSLSPTSKNYGTVYVGSSSANQTFTITNTGAGTLTITAGGITIVGTDISQFILTDVNTYPINLTNGQSATVNVKFSPTSTGAKTASLQIVDNTTGSPHTAALTGVGATPPTIPYSTDFEAFVAGQQAACQDPINWTTWSNLPCDPTEDPYISSTYAYSGTKSVKIVQNNDFVKPLLAQTTGKWSISFMQYIPTGKTGYFNTLALFAGGSSVWGMECYFNAGGAGSLNAGSATPTTFTWIPNSWKKVEVIVDLNLNLAEFWYGGTLVKSWQWTLGATGTGCPLQVDANDFFGATANDEMYLDDYSFQPVTNTFQLSVNIANGWNMVSIPGLNTPDQNVGTWWAFKDPTANVFKYAGGYQAVATATPGLGYWMKNSGDRTYNTGDEWPAGGIQIVAHDPLTGAAGWNLIGGYEISATAALVTTIPSGQQSGPIYKYAAGYQVATTIDPGYGYWIKLLSAAQIIIPETLAKGEKPKEWFPEDWGRIVLTDATGINYTLYSVKGQVDLSQYELPPAPMEGMFDIRFSSGRIAEDINSSMQTIDMSGVTYPITVRVDGMDIRVMDETGKTLNVNLKSGENVIISDGTINKLMVSSQLIPDKYALEQNYPNPFNPSTVIEFSLPEDVSNVKLSIYNALGEKVAELVNTSLVAGKYSYQWNAQNVATGMYIYELRTDKFVSVKKMLLLK
jgi:hypothetical protein